MSTSLRPRRNRNQDGQQKEGSSPKAPRERQYVDHSYEDMSLSPVVKPPGKAKDRIQDFGYSVFRCNSKKMNFVMHLYQILYDCSRSTEKLPLFAKASHSCKDPVGSVLVKDVISWLPHGRAFVVRHHKLFENHILGKYLSSAKYGNFNRQLNIYGFKHLVGKRDSGSYYHQCFLRGRPDLVYLIKRQCTKNNGYKPISRPEDEPNFYNYPFMSDEDNDNEGVMANSEGGNLSENSDSQTSTVNTRSEYKTDVSITSTNPERCKQFPGPFHQSSSDVIPLGNKTEILSFQKANSCHLTSITKESLRGATKQHMYRTRSDSDIPHLESTFLSESSQKDDFAFLHDKVEENQHDDYNHSGKFSSFNDDVIPFEAMGSKDIHLSNSENFELNFLQSIEESKKGACSMKEPNTNLVVHQSTNYQKDNSSHYGNERNGMLFYDHKMEIDFYRRKDYINSTSPIYPSYLDPNPVDVDSEQSKFDSGVETIFGDHERQCKMSSTFDDLTQFSTQILPLPDAVISKTLVSHGNNSQASCRSDSFKVEARVIPTQMSVASEPMMKTSNSNYLQSEVNTNLGVYKFNPTVAQRHIIPKKLSEQFVRHQQVDSITVSSAPVNLYGRGDDFHSEHMNVYKAGTTNPSTQMPQSYHPSGPIVHRGINLSEESRKMVAGDGASTSSKRGLHSMTLDQYLWNNGHELSSRTKSFPVSENSDGGFQSEENPNPVTHHSRNYVQKINVDPMTSIVSGSSASYKS